MLPISTEHIPFCYRHGIRMQESVFLAHDQADRCSLRAYQHSRILIYDRAGTTLQCYRVICLHATIKATQSQALTGGTGLTANTSTAKYAH